MPEGGGVRGTRAAWAPACEVLYSSKAAALRSKAKQRHRVEAQEVAMTWLLTSRFVSWCAEQACMSRDKIASVC